MSDTPRDGDTEPKDVINRRVQDRYDELRAAGKHGHYETMFRIVHEERGAALREARAEIKMLRAQLKLEAANQLESALPPPPAAAPVEWRPIETAPRDGTMVWVYTAPIGPPKISGYLAGFQCPCAYHPDAGWCTDELREVTHWVPFECVDLAPPPAASQEGET